MKPKTPFAFTFPSPEPENPADTATENGRATHNSRSTTRTAALDMIKDAYSLAETYAADQISSAADFRFVQLDSDASETYLQ
jgi:hypothetical protein